MIRTLLLLISLAGAQARTGSIAGRIQMQDGSPAVGVRVMAIQSGDMMGVVQTDSEGRYELKDLAAGPYVIAAGLIGTFTYAPGTTDDTKANPITVRAATQTANVDFKLASTAGVRIRGIVEAPAGNFPKARQATLHGRTDADPKDEVVQPDGSFEFRGVLPGDYTIEFEPTGQDLAIKVGTTNLDNIRVKAPAVISARVFVEEGGPLLTSPAQVNSAALQLSITTTPADGSGLTHHRVTPNGTAAFMLPRGHAYIVEMYSVPFGYYVKSIRSGGANVVADKLDVNDSVDTKSVDVVLTAQRPTGEEPGVTVRGRVTSTAPLPPGVQVTMTMTPPLFYHAIRVEPDGSFSFRNVPSGPYSVNVANTLMNGKTVVVRDTDIDGIDLAVSAQIRVKGRVEIEGKTSQTPRISFTVLFVRTDNFSRNLAINSDSFGMVLLEGTYTLQIYGLPARFAVKSIRYGSQNAASGLVLDEGKPLEELLITLQDKEAPQ
jgi:hypothetical protein